MFYIIYQRDWGWILSHFPSHRIPSRRIFRLSENFIRIWFCLEQCCDTSLFPPLFDVTRFPLSSLELKNFNVFRLTSKLTVHPIFLPSTSPSFMQSLPRRRTSAGVTPCAHVRYIYTWRPSGASPVVEQPLHESGDGGDQGDAALPPGLALDLLQQAGGRDGGASDKQGTPLRGGRKTANGWRGRGGGGGRGWRKLVQRKRRQSSKKGRGVEGGGRGLLPFTLVSPMLVSLIVAYAIKALRNLATNTTVQNIHFFFNSYCKHFNSC